VELVALCCAVVLLLGALDPMSLSQRGVARL
jgi:hypothetical protein